MLLSMSSGGSVLRSADNFSLLQASIVTIAEPSLPLLISSPQRLTAWWCRIMSILFRVWLLHLGSMCGALSDPPHNGHNLACSMITKSISKTGSCLVCMDVGATEGDREHLSSTSSHQHINHPRTASTLRSQHPSTWHPSIEINS